MARTRRRRAASRAVVALATLLVVAGPSAPGYGRAPGATDSSSAPSSALADARAGFTTHLTREIRLGGTPPTPPAGVLDAVRYPSAVGDLAAYVTPDPGDGERHPAIIWVIGGDNNSIEDVWTPRPASNDQTASAFRDAGIVEMYASQRGGNDNPGKRESFLGECDDIIAAANYLAGLPYVDPDRIYLGGHSTGGTLTLLVAELPNPFRAIFSYGPIGNPVWYHEPRYTPFDTTDAQEVRLRSPAYWLTSIHTPTWVLEGTRRPSNIKNLEYMASRPHSGDVHFVKLRGEDHFTELRPTNDQLVQAILADDGTGAFELHLTRSSG